MLEQIVNPGKILREVKEYLKPEGKIQEIKKEYKERVKGYKIKTDI